MKSPNRQLGPLTDHGFGARIQFFHNAVTEWLRQSGVSITCGHWAEGSAIELAPDEDCILLPTVEGACFSGIRELRWRNARHRMHVDLGRVHTLAYTISAGVSTDFKPTFEMRLLVSDAGGIDTEKSMASLRLPTALSKRIPDRALISGFFEKFAKHWQQQPTWVRLDVAPQLRNTPEIQDLLEILPDSGMGSFFANRAEFCEAQRHPQKQHASLPEAEPLTLDALR